MLCDDCHFFQDQLILHETTGLPVAVGDPRCIHRDLHGNFPVTRKGGSQSCPCYTHREIRKADMIRWYGKPTWCPEDDEWDGNYMRPFRRRRNGRM